MCFHFAKNQIVPTYYPTVAKTLFTLAAELCDSVEIGYIDLMGGLGIDYRHGDEVPTLQEISAQIESLYEAILVPAGLAEVPIHTELGRYLMAPCAVLVSSITHVRHSFRDFIALDASAADLIRPMLYGGYHHISILGKHDMVGRQYYDVVGPMDSSSDRFGERRLLPIPEPGDPEASFPTADFSGVRNICGLQTAGRCRSERLWHRSHFLSRRFKEWPGRSAWNRWKKRRWPV